jgi:ABC-type lipoprotein export system ATPase subunit
MIDIQGLRQKYHRSPVLNGIEMKLPRRGIVGILGPSGSGKSTFLKVLSGLLPFEGHIRFQEQDLESADARQRLDLRLIHIGLLYQSYRLFEHETVAWNLALPLRLLGYSEVIVKRHTDDWLAEVGLSKNRHQLVSTLSGGEKQRLAVARTLIKQPRVILADEPTAALDEINKTAIFNLFSQMKDQRLIIVVSHEQALLERYADTVYKFEDGQIIAAYHPSKVTHVRKTIHRRLTNHIHRGTLPWLFCFRHARADMKIHKWRHLFAQSMLTLALLGTGIGLSLATAIPKKMTATFDHLMGRPGIQITSKERPLGYLSTLHAAEEQSLVEIKDRYADNDLGIGVAYRNDVNGLFPDRNQIFLIATGPIIVLPSFQARHLADAMTFAELGIDHHSLDDDEIFLAVPETDFKIIARHLRCEFSVAVVNQILETEEVFLGAGFANLAWQYEDEQMWRLKGIAISESAHVVHSNPRFNEFVFETSMRFPISHDLEGPLERPWILRKAFCLLSPNNPNLLATLSQDIALRMYRFDLINHEYLPSYCPRFGPCRLLRYLVLYDPLNTISEAEIAYIQKMEPGLSSALMGTEGGYLIYPEAMISGFAHETFLAGDRSALEQAIDWFSLTEPAQQVDRLPDRTVRGYYQDQSERVVRLRPFPSFDYQGWPPMSTDEIAISTGLAAILYGNNPELGTKMHYATRFIVGHEEGRVHSEFHDVELTLTALVPGNGIYVYGGPLWSRRFFNEQMGISPDSLRPLTVVFEGEEARLEAAAARIKRQFPHLDIGFPQADLHRQIKTVTTNIDYVVVALAGFAGINAVILALLVADLSWSDMAKDRRLLFEMGASSDNAQQLILARLIILFGSALLMAIIGLIAASFLIEKMLADYFSSPSRYAFPFLSVSAMIGMTLGLGAFVAMMNRFRRREG